MSYKREPLVHTRLSVKKSLDMYPGRPDDYFLAVVGPGLNLGDNDPERAPRCTPIGRNIWVRDAWLQKNYDVYFKFLVVHSLTNKIVDMEIGPCHELHIAETPITAHYQFGRIGLSTTQETFRPCQTISLIRTQIFWNTSKSVPSATAATSKPQTYCTANCHVDTDIQKGTVSGDTPKHIAPAQTDGIPKTAEINLDAMTGVTYIMDILLARLDSHISTSHETGNALNQNVTIPYNSNTTDTTEETNPKTEEHVQPETEHAKTEVQRQKFMPRWKYSPNTLLLRLREISHLYNHVPGIQHQNIMVESKIEIEAPSKCTMEEDEVCHVAPSKTETGTNTDDRVYHNDREENTISNKAGLLSSLKNVAAIAGVIGVSILGCSVLFKK